MSPPPLDHVATHIADAMAVVTGPERLDRPTLRALAWRTLKAARGQSCDLARLDRIARAATFGTGGAA